MRLTIVLSLMPKSWASAFRSSSDIDASHARFDNASALVSFSIGAMVPAKSDTDAGLATSDSPVSANRCAEDIVARYVV